MRRLLPDTLAGRTIVILVVGLGLFHLWSIWIYQIGSENLLGPSRNRELAEHLVSTAHALGELPADQREPTALALSSPDLQIHWGRTSPISDRAAETSRLADLRRHLRQLLPAFAEDQLRFGYAADADIHRHRLVAALRLPDGSWVSFGSNAFLPEAATEHDVLGSLTAMAAGILVVSIFLVRSLTAPLRALADAADRLGTDLSAPGAPVSGPREIRQVARAFNTMQARIRRLISDRTQTLAAVSHDLKTPLTRLRLRAEFVGDGELRSSIDNDLDEMEHMIDSALAFLRGNETGEESKVSDLGSILKTICDHFGDAGQDVALAGDRFAPLRCRPLAIKRALSNLIENAIKYGGRARVTVHDNPQEVIVSIEDDGPGIPPAERERVFDPFYRIEASRSRETGGSGLGLTIARTVVRAHGGDITLGTGAAGGLRAMVTLPKAGPR